MQQVGTRTKLSAAKMPLLTKISSCGDQLAATPGNTTKVTTLQSLVPDQCCQATNSPEILNSVAHELDGLNTKTAEVTKTIDTFTS